MGMEWVRPGPERPPRKGPPPKNNSFVLTTHPPGRLYQAFPELPGACQDGHLQVHLRPLDQHEACGFFFLITSTFTHTVSHRTWTTCVEILCSLPCPESPRPGLHSITFCCLVFGMIVKVVQPLNGFALKPDSRALHSVVFWKSTGELRAVGRRNPAIMDRTSSSNRLQTRMKRRLVLFVVDM